LLSQIATQAKVQLSNVQGELEAVAQQKESVSSAATRQLIQRRDKLVHSALAEAIARLEAVSTKVY
jgi:hypothetical protein